MGLEQIGKFVMKAAAQKYSMNQQRKAQKASAAQSSAPQRQDVLVNKQSNSYELKLAEMNIKIESDKAETLH